MKGLGGMECKTWNAFLKNAWKSAHFEEDLGTPQKTD